MTQKISVTLGNVQRTLLLPLWGRAVETRKPRPILTDTTAAEIVGRIDYDFTAIAKNMSPITRLTWIARPLHIDRTIRRFLARDARGTIVNIGCGLDTTFERVDNGALSWIDLDLPDVMALRAQFIRKNDRRTQCATSFLTEAWMDTLPREHPVLFIAAGVFYYIDEALMREFFGKLAGRFPGAEIIFDAATPFGVRVANKKVIEAAGMSTQSMLQWGIEHASIITLWDDRIRVLEEYPMFKGFHHGLTVGEHFGTFMSDLLRVMYMVHLAVSP
jgi:O-methyltransferase involved in polyketide biosynthesis